MKQSLRVIVALTCAALLIPVAARSHVAGHGIAGIGVDQSSHITLAIAGGSDATAGSGGVASVGNEPFTFDCLTITTGPGVGHYVEGGGTTTTGKSFDVTINTTNVPATWQVFLVTAGTACAPSIMQGYASGTGVFAVGV